MKMSFSDKTLLLWVSGVLIVLPLFFQLEGGSYRDVVSLMDSRGSLKNLPLPVSILTGLIALALFPNRVYSVRPTVLMITGVAAVSLVSLWLGGDGVTPADRKALMAVQVLLPIVGLLLGQLIDEQQKTIARAFLIVLSLLVPWQLFATWLQDSFILTHYLYAFSIYSHLQYVPLILVCAFTYSLVHLWEDHKVWLCVLALPMLIYVLAGLSFLTISAYMLVLLVFSVGKLWAYRANVKLGLTFFFILLAILVTGATYFNKMYEHGISSGGDPEMFKGKFKRLTEGRIPANVQERFGDWRLFGNEIVESPKTLFFGHPQPMPREIRSSPHNWYIDVAHTFGLVGLVPITALIGYTTLMCWRNRKKISTPTWWLAAIVFYMVVIDSNFKVTLRQPYPGIFTYFLWGMLLTRLHVIANQRSLNDRVNGRKVL